MSKEFDVSSQYSGEIVSKYYSFFPIDKSEVDGRFVIMYEGNSYDSTGFKRPARLKGDIEISGCNGAGELTFLPGGLYTSSASHITRPESLSTGDDAVSLKWVELNSRRDKPDNDFTLKTNTYISANSLRITPVLMQTPEIFKMSPAWHYSYMDRLSEKVGVRYSYSPVFAGTWLPFFYNDKKRTFFVLPSSNSPTIGQSHSYYPEIKSNLRGKEGEFEGQVQTSVDGIVGVLTDSQRDFLALLLGWWNQEEKEEVKPRPTEEQFKSLIKQSPMQAVYVYLTDFFDQLLQSQQFHFKNFYHPFMCDFAKLVNNPLKGIPALMSRETQLKNSGFRFFNTYQPDPDSVVEWTGDPKNPHSKFYPEEVVDFTPDGAYSPYNWELFFHAPC